MRLRRVLLAPLLALLLPLLADLLARLRPLLRRHLLPPLPVARDALALFRRQLLPHLEALHDALATLGGQALEALVRLLQLLAARLGQLVPALQILKDALLLLRWQRLELLEVLARAMPLLRSELLPLALGEALVAMAGGRRLAQRLEVGQHLGVEALGRAVGGARGRRERGYHGEERGHPAHQPSRMGTPSSCRITSSSSSRSRRSTTR